MNMDFDPIQRKLVNGPEAGQNTKVDGFTVSFIGGGTEGTVYNAGAGLTLTGNIFAANVAAVGFGMELQDGTASYARYRAIETVSGSSVTLQAGHAYRIYATSAVITLNAEPIPSGMYGQEGHLEIFVAGTGYVVTGSNVVLANALEPDAVNNCTVRFHDGIAIIAVEDHVAGYIVVNGSTSGEGSLAYGITTSTNDYVAFNASLNGTTIPLAGAVAEGEKHLVGNGYSETTLTGAVDCGTSKFTVANLALQDVVVNGGTMTLGDAYIPSGSTVVVSGGGLAVEKVTGNGTINALSGIDNATVNVAVSGITFTGGANAENLAYLGAISGDKNRSGYMSACTFSGIACSNGRNLYLGGTSVSPFLFEGCTFAENFRPGSAGVMINALQVPSTRYARIKDCSFGEKQGVQINGTLYFAGTNSTLSYLARPEGSGSAIFESGAIIDLTGNTNATPIAPGGGIVFESGGATVKVGDSTASSSYMMDNVTLPAGAKLTNTAVVDLANSRVVVSGSSVGANGCTLTSGSSYDGMLIVNNGGEANLSDCIISGNSGTLGYMTVTSGGVLKLTGCTVTDGTYNPDAGYRGIKVLSNGQIYITDTTFADGLSLRSGNAYFGGTVKIPSDYIPSPGNGVLTISAGTIVDLTGNSGSAGTGVVLNPGGGITFVSGGNKMIRYGSGTSSGTRLFEDVEIRGSSISNQGIIYGATVYFPESHGPLDVWYTTDSGTTSSSVQISGGTPTFVVDGGLVSVES